MPKVTLTSCLVRTSKCAEANFAPFEAVVLKLKEADSFAAAAMCAIVYVGICVCVRHQALKRAV